jgi:hypothetical protein
MLLIYTLIGNNGIDNIYSRTEFGIEDLGSKKRRYS